MALSNEYKTSCYFGGIKAMKHGLKLPVACWHLSVLQDAQHIPGEVHGCGDRQGVGQVHHMFFHLGQGHNPSVQTMALLVTTPLQKKVSFLLFP